jgi:hypothetical protein
VVECLHMPGLGFNSQLRKKKKKEGLRKPVTSVEHGWNTWYLDELNRSKGKNGLGTGDSRL